METITSRSIRSERMSHGANYSVKIRHDSQNNEIMAWVRNDGRRADTVLKITHAVSNLVDSWLIKPDRGFKGDDMDMEVYIEGGVERIKVIQTCHEVANAGQAAKGKGLPAQVELGQAEAAANDGRLNDHCITIFERQPSGSRPLYRRVG